MPTTLYNVVEGLTATAFAIWCTLTLRRSRTPMAALAGLVVVLATAAWSVLNLVLLLRSEGHALVSSDAMQGAVEATLCATASACAIQSLRARRRVIAVFCLAVAAVAMFPLAARIFLWVLFSLYPLPSLWGPGH